MGVESNLSNVPPVRSRSMATEVTKNITMNGNTPRRGAPIRSKVPSPLNIHARIVIRIRGTTSMSPIVR
jgi:hypothetical protein